MPNPSKGARLWLRPGRGTEKTTWVIRDGSKQIRTGCSPSQREIAEQRLAAHIAEKYRPARQRDRDPSAISVADVLNVYMADIKDKISRPGELGQRMVALLSFFETRSLGDINGALCRSYAQHRGSESMARRELEDLRAAINHHRKEGLCNAVVEITLPPRAPARERWLTRSEAAKMIWAAWRYREVQKGHETDRRSRRHIARFMLVALYTGTRSGAICGAAIRPAIGRGHVDLEAGIFYRRAHGAAETKKRRPTIRLPERLLAHLRRWERLGISKHSIVEFGPPKLDKNGKPGKPLGSVRKAFAKVAASVGLIDVTPHILRHTAVTWAMQNAADPYDAADFFGMTLEVLERVYGHHHPDHQKGVGEALTGRSMRGARNERNGREGAADRSLRK
jgi:integrase